jgi:hypothetical protein
MRGIPGSGKSHFGENCLAIPGYKLIVVSADHFFIRDGVYKFNGKQLSIAHLVCRKKFHEALCSATTNTLIVVDNTNTTALEIAYYYGLATVFTKDVKIMEIVEPPFDPAQRDEPTWVEQCASRNQHGVPLNKVAEMNGRLTSSKLPGYWKKRKVERHDGYFVVKHKNKDVRIEA